MHANASRDSNVDYDRVAREIIAEAKATDEAEDQLYGDARGDELPPSCRLRLAGGSGSRASLSSSAIGALRRTSGVRTSRIVRTLTGSMRS
jgi:hypothetical protein